MGGDGRPKPQGGDRLSRRTEAHGDLIRGLLVEEPDITLPELKVRLAQSGAVVSVAALWRFCKRHKLTRKKRLRTRASRIGSDVLKRREEWFESQLDLDPELLVFMTKFGPRRRWPAHMGAARAGSSCERASLTDMK